MGLWSQTFRKGHTYDTTRKINDRTPIEVVTEEPQDISEYVEFYFYDLVWYHTVNNTSMSKKH